MIEPDLLLALDELAARMNSSRSRIVGEAIRRYAARQGRTEAAPRDFQPLDPSRLEQLRRDMALTPTERVHISEEIAAIGLSHDGRPLKPLTFKTYDDFIKWRLENGYR